MFIIRPTVRWLVRRSMMRTVRGRLRDRDVPGAGRISSADVDEILRRAWRHADALLQDAHLERYPLLGNRLNVFLSVLTLAAYRAFREQGFSDDYAVELFGDAGWNVYAAMVVPARTVARILHRAPRRQMAFVLRTLMRFPFGMPRDPDVPGYRVETWEDEAGVHTHWSSCPPLEFFRANARPEEQHVFARTWCAFDFAIAQQMAYGGRFERSKTLSGGDRVCDMLWRVDGVT